MNYLLSLQIVKKEDLIDLGFYNPLELIDVDPSPVLDNFKSYIELDKEDQLILKN